MRKPSFFDAVEAINSHKIEKDVFAEYDQYLINRQFSYFPDTIFIAQEMNAAIGLTDRQHFSYYYGTVRPKPRFTRWAKKEQSEMLDFLRETFRMTSRRAKEALLVLTDEQISKLKGG